MEGAVENSKTKRTRNQEVDDPCYGTTAKKQRIRWTTDLHEKFLQAIALITERKNPYNPFGSCGESQVVPKEILEEMRRMGVKGLDRHHVSSHLQKHRSTHTKIKGRDSLDQQQSKIADPSYYYMPIMEQQPLPMAQQLMIPHSQPFHHRSIWNPGSCNVDVGTAPMNLHFSRSPFDCFGSQNRPMMFLGPHSVYQLGFSSPTYHPEFINTGPYGTASPPPSLGSIDYQSPEAASNIINPEVHFPSQHACVGPDTITTATNECSSIGNSEAPATLCDQDTGLLGLDGLDLLWNEDLIGEGNDLN